MAFMGMDSLKDIPVIGESLYDVRQGLHGNPDAIKAAYDQQIQASKEHAERMKQFLMEQKGQAQAFYAPVQHLFQSAYGTEGLMPPQIPGVQGGGPISQLYAPPQSAPPQPNGKVGAYARKRG